MRQMEDKQKLDRIMAKINGLLAKAEATTFKEEAQLYRDKAEELIQKHRIEQEHLLAVDEKVISPVMKQFPISRWNSEFKDWMWTLFLRVAEHCEVRTKADWEREGEELYLVGKAVGYEIDLRFMELLWSSIRLTFIAKLEPEFDPGLTIEENIYRLRSSGIPRKDVAAKIWGKWTHSNSAKVARVYKEECERRGEKIILTGRGMDLKTFRETYAREFTWRVDDRLRRARDAALAQGGQMVFADRSKRVDEAFYKFFPNLRPKPEPEQSNCETEISVSDEPPKKGRKRLAYHETKAYEREMDRKYNSSAARAGSAAGAHAGDQVDISRTAPKTERLGYESKSDSAMNEIEGGDS